MHNQTPWLRRLRRILRMTAGIALMGLGVLGLALPIMPGWALMLVGIALVAPRSRLAQWLKRTLARLRKQWARQKGSVPSTSG
ncbi:MAG TPA: hypothetical protein DCZ95_06670 [Verrucomicrobia bacterium]|nr:MAG: hypothetical protein A2X46_10545 [Lentisphaerae bacterium GWF2_57_35]HBA83761.1 hypothetical protein [Verrucomicrobiota bacterium]